MTAGSAGAWTGALLSSLGFSGSRGTETGGGSIRIHDRAVQSKIFDLLNLTPEQAECHAVAAVGNPEILWREAVLGTALFPKLVAGAPTGPAGAWNGWG